MTPTEFRQTFEPLFQEKITSLITRAQQVSKNAEFNKAIHHIGKLAKHGKRIRPYIINLAYNNKKFNQTIVGQMIGLELLHLFALIHDDIMDTSTMRHGVKTLHTLYKDKNLSRSYAMLAGDMVFNWAYECFIQDNSNKKSIEIFRTLVEEVIVGQAIDATLPNKKQISEAELTEKNILKTARYTFRRPAEIGLVLAGKNIHKAHQKITENLGIIYQIDDDLLDILGDEKKLKKKTFQDIESKQATLVSLYLSKNTLFKKNFGKKLNTQEKEQIKKLLETSGVLEKIQGQKTSLVQKTEKLIDSISQKQDWLILLNTIALREK